MAAITQVGEDVVIGFGGNTVTGLVMRSVSVASTGEQKVLKDEDNATFCVLVEDLGQEIDIEAMILSDYEGETPPEKGSTIAINSVNYRVVDASLDRGAEEAVLRVKAIKEDAMTYQTETPPGP